MITNKERSQSALPLPPNGGDGGKGIMDIEMNPNSLYVGVRLYQMRYVEYQCLPNQLQVSLLLMNM